MTRCAGWRPMRKPLLQTVLDVCGVVTLHGGKVEESILYISTTHGTADARRTGRWQAAQKDSGLSRVIVYPAFSDQLCVKPTP